MTHRTDEAPRREVIARWCSLAEQRLNYLTDMFESGRWRRYYTEVAFLENIKEAKFAVETWRGLSTPHLARAVTAVELPTPALAQGIAAAELALSELTAPAPGQAAEPDHVPIAPDPCELAAEDEMMAVEEAASAEEAPSEPVIDMLALEQALDVSDTILDMTAIERRYPLLRNAL
jgi:uncharacterized repeat protein (TIGR03809 family)